VGKAGLHFTNLCQMSFETKTDHHIGYARTEYHCKNCGGHHGHIFEDGPQPTGKRYCNNGVCLIFKPSK
jgi:Conserved domain frequently associated with peptide methionine sulfoxide reductase